MKQSIITKIANALKNITGIKDFSLLEKTMRKKIGKMIYHEKYNAQDVISIMENLGMKKGSVVCVHSAMREFYNYNGTVQNLIDGILEVITEEGTLIMPCFPKKSLIKKDGYVFSLDDPTGAGCMSEVFRKYPGVKRSINVQHSVAVWGKNAEWLVKDHQSCLDCWDVNSPWRRMLEMDALVFNLGLPRQFIGTFRHCVESTLKGEHPYWSQFFTKEKEYKYYDKNGDVQIYKSKTIDIERRHSRTYADQYFDSSDWQIRKISNLEIKVFYTKNCFPKMLELGRKGISPYYLPSTKKFKFN